MATRHVLLGMGNRLAVETSAALPLAERTKLTVSLLVASVAGALTVDVQLSPTTAEADYATVTSYNVNAAGKTDKTTTADFTVQAWHRFLRVVVTGVNSATFEVSVSAPWIDTSADAALFSKELRGFIDGYARLVSDAEDKVMEQLTPRNERPEPSPYYRPALVPMTTQHDAEMYAGAPFALLVDADMSLPGFNASIRTAIVRQAEHSFGRHKLSQQNDAPSIVSLRTYPPLAPGLMDGLARYRNSTSNVWRGR